MTQLSDPQAWELEHALLTGKYARAWVEASKTPKQMKAPTAFIVLAETL